MNDEILNAILLELKNINNCLDKIKVCINNLRECLGKIEIPNHLKDLQQNEEYINILRA